MKSLKSIKVVTLCFIFLFILIGAFSKNNADTLNGFFPNDQTINGPGFFPFSNSQEVVTVFNEQCPYPRFLFDGPDSLSGSKLEVGPAANNSETGSRDILVFDMNGNVSLDFLSAFPLSNPSTMVAFDPSMGDILGLSIVPGVGFPSSSTTLMITTSFNCDDGMSTTSSTSSTSSSSSSGGSSSGISFTPVQSIGFAINNERLAKGGIDLKDLISGMTSSFSVSMAIHELQESTKELMRLQTEVDTTTMLGMSTIQGKLTEAINNDNEAIMLLEPFKDTDPSLTDSEFTQAVTRAKKLISEAMRAKELIKVKLKKLEDKGK